MFKLYDGLVRFARLTAPALLLKKSNWGRAFKVDRRLKPRTVRGLQSLTMNRKSEQETLLGGNSSSEVVRVGDTVRRMAGPWSASVDALLLHFRESGLVGVPRPMGYDEFGRQVLSFVNGYVSPDPSDLDENRLSEVGRLIRAIHDTSESFIPPNGAQWNVLIAPDEEVLICHHDLAPWNLVRTPTALTFIDWDGAGPGSRLWDLAYAVHGFVPLAPEALLSDQEASRRLLALVDGYDLIPPERVRLAELLGPRIRSMHDFLRASHERGVQPWNRLWEEGHGTVWLSHAIFVEENRAVWEEALKSRIKQY